MLSPPPFKLATAATAGAPLTARAAACCDADEPAGDDAPAPGRVRLSDLDPHLHCSVLGTCLSTAELRKVMARFIDVRGAADLALHHDAVSLASEARVAKALHKALDRRHEAVVQRFAKTRDTRELELLWEEALRLGEVPGAYWAVLTHRSGSAELRQRVFGDVHMLSHLVGAANRADIRRLVALERDNADLHERLERQQARSQQLQGERDAAWTRLQQQASEAPTPLPASPDPDPDADADADAEPGTDLLVQRIALQTDRRERAESAAAVALADAGRLQQELAHARDHARALARELAAAEAQLHERAEGDTADAPGSLAPRLKDRRILYVGGRPSSTPAIRDLVQRAGGEFQKHDGGLEDRKGLLESAVSWAEFVLFPVDCIDHDSAIRLKRVCMRLGTPFVPLRSAGVASFAVAVAEIVVTGAGLAQPGRPPMCTRHA